MRFRPDRPLFRRTSYFILTAMCFFVVRDLIFPCPVFAQTTARQYLAQGKKHWERFEEDEAIVSLDKALELGLDRNDDRIEAHTILARCWAAKRDLDRVEHHFLEILKIDPDFSLSLTETPVLLEPFRNAMAEFTPRDTTPRDTTAPVIEHDRVESSFEGQALIVTARVTDESGVGSVHLFYRISGDDAYSQTAMERSRGDFFRGAVPAEEVGEAGIEYYLTAFDVLENGPASVGSEQEPIRVEVLHIDKAPPVITHQPPEAVEEGETVTITSTITDPSGIDEAVVRYKHTDDRRYQSIVMEAQESDLFEALVPGSAVSPPALLYYIMARDGAGNEGFFSSIDEPYTLQVSTKPVVPPVVAEVVDQDKPKERKGKKTLLWIGLGAAVATGGVLVAILGGKGGGGKSEDRPVLNDPPPWPGN